MDKRGGISRMNPFPPNKDEGKRIGVVRWRGDTHLVNAAHDGPHGRISRPVHGFPVVRRPPWGAINVYEVRFVAHAVRLDQVGHVRLIQHSDPGYLRVVSYAHAAHAVVPGRRHLAGASRSVAFSRKEKTKLSIR